MIKIIILLISLLLSLLTSFSFSGLKSYIYVIIIICFTILYVVGFVFLFFLSALIITIPVNNKKVPNKYSRFYRSVYNFYVWCCLQLFGVKIRYKGKELLPNNNFVLISNHVSNCDPLVTNNVMKEAKLIFASKKSLFKIPFFGKMIHKIGYLKFDRIDSFKDLGEIKRAIEWINDGISLAIYPEGTRNKTEINLLDFKDQVVKFAINTKKPLVISGIYGTKYINNKLLFKRHNVDFEIIEVINYEEYSKMNVKELANYCHDKIEKWIEEKVKTFN